MKKFMQFAVVLFSAFVLVLVASPISAANDQAKEPAASPTKGRVIMWMVERDATGAITKQQEYTRRAPVLGEPIFHEGLDMQSKIEFKRARLLLDAMRPDAASIARSQAYYAQWKKSNAPVPGGSTELSQPVVIDDPIYGTDGPGKKSGGSCGFGDPSCPKCGTAIRDPYTGKILDCPNACIDCSWK